jgi:hypothetical protein
MVGQTPTATGRLRDLEMVAVDAETDVTVGPDDQKRVGRR